jgi:hypothetical protein
MTINDIIYFLHGKGPRIIKSEFVSREYDFHIIIKSNPNVTVDVLKGIEVVKKVKDHSEFNYYSPLGESIVNLQGIYAIAPFLNKIDFESGENELKIELFARR